MCAADTEMFLRLQQAAGGNIRLVTLAPEVEGAIAFIENLVQDRIIVSLGHTAANNETIQQAVDAGARLSTHLGNGTCQELLKNNNPIIAQLSEDRLSASFIADGYHLSPDVLKTYLRAKCTERVILVTDATAGAAAPQGRYKLGNSELKRETEPVILDPQTSRPVGSAVTLDQCVRNVINWYEMPLKEAVSWATENPLQLLNSAKVKTKLSAGERNVWWKEEEEEWQVKAARSGKFLFEN
jgi:N-acetylglucosamine-6-phosphate deacetylase